MLGRLGELTGRQVLVAAGLLVVAHLAVRGWIAASRDFYGDDLLIAGRAALTSPFSGDYLFGDFDGQFMPGAFLLAGLVDQVAPLQWWPEAVALVVLAALAALAVLRLLRTVLGDTPRLLLPLGFFLFSPLSLGPSAWWASAINSLPLQIGLAWFVADAIVFCRTGRKRNLATGLLVLALTYCFYLKAVLIAPLAFATVAVLLLMDGERRVLPVAWQQGRQLWLGSIAVTVGWLWAYLAVVPSESVGSATPRDVAELAWSGLTEAVLPGLVGGPWQWTSEPGSVPIADPPLALLLAAMALVGVAAWHTSTTRRGATAVWVLAGLHTAAGLVLVGIGRAGVIDDSIPPLAFRHYAGDAVALALAGALLLRAPAGDPGRGPARVGWTMPTDTRRRVLVPLAALLFVASSLVSTATYLQAWGSSRVGDYLANARSSLAAAGSEPLLDQAVPPDVLWPLAYPNNMASRALAALPDRPEFVSSTTDLRVLDEDGELRPGVVQPGVFVAPGPVEDCGYLLGPDDVGLLLEQPVFDWAWTLQITYVSDRAGTLGIALGLGQPITVPIAQGSNQLFVSVNGGGAGLQLTRQTPGMALCVTSGLIGNVAPE
ncbi:hypothetical protein GB931_06675 [Modestobacter sp. I12A-02628]|uniref:Transmembrane protein n=1 Tax=Goekera deserti TaxID=2497753 RepID=A0A7K3WB44_9ACTN|nr:hypothetical protein [Goekera deserti]MPQ97608.1 hypothetical protein [Goekera deserti]NDI47788.1 hypothetical protein [Goekera deserti]NEL53536.1 hypothetical protein [Goekera deserti]